MPVDLSCRHSRPLSSKLGALAFTRSIAGAAGDVLGLADDHLNDFGEHAPSSSGLLLMLDSHRSPQNPQENECADPEHGIGEAEYAEDDGQRQDGHLPKPDAAAFVSDL